MGMYAVKTTASQERTVADMIMNREESSVHAALAPNPSRATSWSRPTTTRSSNA